MIEYGKNKKYKDIFYKNIFEAIARRRGVKSITQWCQDNDVDRALIYQSTLAAKRGRGQGFSTILKLADIAGVDFIELLKDTEENEDHENTTEQDEK